MTVADLGRLVAEASVLAGGDHPCHVLGHKWEFHGGRHCGCEEGSCSLPVHECPESGSRVTFAGERMPYTVQARNDRFLVCTKPFAARKTVIYSIVDLQRQVRGPCNLIFGMDASSEAACRDALNQLTAGEMEVSHRRHVPLEIAALRVQASTPKENDRG